MKTVFVVFKLVDGEPGCLLGVRLTRANAMTFADDHKPAVILEQITRPGEKENVGRITVT